MEENIPQKNMLAKLEAFLFIYGEAVEVKKLAKIFGVKEAEIESGLIQLREELKNENRGLTLIWDKNRVQLATKPEFSKLLEDITKEEFTGDLTPAGLETLAIVAYAGPISRADLEFIRGVNSSFILRSLLMRGLIEREIDPKRANAFIYSASLDILKKLGLSKAADLPDFQKYNSLVKQLYQETKTEEDKPQPEAELNAS
jgi:segregation and condensation protein B